jgi:hypothetical protein
MCGVVAVALTISASVFVSLSVGASLAFGIDELETNVLSNFSADELAPLVGQVWGDVVSWVIRGGYLVSVLGSLLLYMYPLRSCLAEVLWAGSCQDEVTVDASDSDLCLPNSGIAGRSNSLTVGDAAGIEASVHSGSSGSASVDAAVVLSVCSTDSVADAAEAGQVTLALQGGLHGNQRQEQAEGGVCGAEHLAVLPPQQQQPRWQQLEQRWYYTLTYGLLLSMVLVAVLVPSIWSALSLIGDLACTTQAFMLPGMIALVLAFKHGIVTSASGAVYVALCGSVVLLGMALFANGMWQRV